MKWSIIFLTLFLLSPVAALGDDNIDKDSQPWPCVVDLNLLVDNTGKPVWIDSAELKAHAVNMPPPKVPSSVRAAGQITVDVSINSDGHVTCLNVRNGHPLLQRAIAETVRTWTFKPFVAGGKPVAIYGHIDFVFGK